MAAKHYAPRARVMLVSHGGFAVPAGQRAAAIVSSPDARAAAAACDPLLVLPDDPIGYARELYAALHTADAANVDVIVIETPPLADPAWRAVADRLARAAR